MKGLTLSVMASQYKVKEIDLEQLWVLHYLFMHAGYLIVDPSSAPKHIFWCVFVPLLHMLLNKSSNVTINSIFLENMDKV